MTELDAGAPDELDALDALGPLDALDAVTPPPLEAPPSEELCETAVLNEDDPIAWELLLPGGLLLDEEPPGASQTQASYPLPSPLQDCAPCAPLVHAQAMAVPGTHACGDDVAPEQPAIHARTPVKAACRHTRDNKRMASFLRNSHRGA